MPTSKAQQRAVAKYDNAHYDKCLLRFKKGELEAARAHAKSLGLSFNAFALLAINKAMSNDSSIDTSNDSSIYASNDSSIDASNDSSISRCIFCGIVIEGKKNKKYCSAKCRMANHRKSKDTTES